MKCVIFSYEDVLRVHAHSQFSCSHSSYVASDKSREFIWNSTFFQTQSQSLVDLVALWSVPQFLETGTLRVVQLSLRRTLADFPHDHARITGLPDFNRLCSRRQRGTRRFLRLLERMGKQQWHMSLETATL